MLQHALVYFMVLVAVVCQLPHDYYHDLHLPHEPPLYPVFHEAPKTLFSCHGRSRGYYADVDSGCQNINVSWWSLEKPGVVKRLYEVTSNYKNSLDISNLCQAFHFCWRQRLVDTGLCGNGTLFNEQFQVCDHFYNVRCGSPYEDL